jgi:hypothetical protein
MHFINIFSTLHFLAGVTNHPPIIIDDVIKVLKAILGF